MNRLWLGIILIVSGLFIAVFSLIDKGNKIVSRISLIMFGMMLIYIYSKHKKFIK